jgi:magnesium chelatase accessory protein
MPDRLRWDVEGRDWPHRDASDFVHAAGLRWHVQRFGRGPTVLLVHGTGASTHTWRHLAPLLAATHSVLALDLPGHAFTDPLPAGAATLPRMAAAVGELLAVLRSTPEICIGHSAGAAVLARMCLDHAAEPRALVSINGALLPLPGVAGLLFSPAARLLASGSIAARLFAWRAGQRGAVEHLVASTGSKLDEQGIELYRRLIASPAHVAGALAMMAAWQLVDLERDLASLATPLLLLVARGDRTVPPTEAARVRRIVREAEVATIEGAGHLVHEEKAAEVALEIRRFV